MAPAPALARPLREDGLTGAGFPPSEGKVVAKEVGAVAIPVTGVVPEAASPTPLDETRFSVPVLVEEAEDGCRSAGLCVESPVGAVRVCCSGRLVSFR
jgi:hypothetical protein